MKRIYTLKASGVMLFFYMYFYMVTNSFFISLIAVPIGVFSLFYLKRIFIKREFRNIEKNFYDYLFCFNSYLLCGNSFLSAHKRTLLNMESIGADKRFLEILNEISLNEKYGNILGKSFEDIGGKYNIEIIKSFGEVINTCESLGSNSFFIIEKIAEVLKNKVRLEEKIKVSLARQQMELRVMKIMPFIMLLILRFMNRDFITVLTNNPIGIIVFLISIGLIILGYYLGDKIMEVVKC